MLRHVGRTVVLAAAIGLPSIALLLVSGAGTAAAQDASVAQLRLDFQNLRYQFDLETRQLRSQVDRLQARLQTLEGGASRPALPMPASPPMSGLSQAAEEVVARRFVVEDAEGRIRAVLGMSDRYGPMLALLTESGDLGSLTSLVPEEER